MWTRRFRYIARVQGREETVPFVKFRRGGKWEKEEEGEGGDLSSVGDTKPRTSTFHWRVHTTYSR